MSTSAHRSSLRAESIPTDVGVGLRFPHHRHVLETKPKIPFFEIHPENYMDARAPLAQLERIRQDSPLSFHAVGLSLGSDAPLDTGHLERLKALIGALQPGLVSDHLSWSQIDGIAYADLLPLPYTEETLSVVARNVARAQEALGHRLLIENPSRYLAFASSTLDEADFLAALVARTGCGILCDINNIFVSACNLGFDTGAYLAALPQAAVGEYHLAGHAVRTLATGDDIRIDHHGAPVAPDVWQLYDQALAVLGPRPTLIEWDTDIPRFSVLEDEAHRARARLRAQKTEAPAYAAAS